MTTSLTITDDFETVQRFEESVQLGYALARHKAAEEAAGITGPRSYTWTRELNGTRWTIKGTADDFPCCSNHECHNCGGHGYIDQQVYLGRPFPTKRSICANCGGTGENA